MKKKIIVLTICLCVIYASISHCSVRGWIDNKFQNNFPDKIAALILHDSTSDKYSLTNLFDIFKKYKITIVPSTSIFPNIPIQENYFLNLNEYTNNNLSKVFFKSLIYNDNLPVTALVDLLKSPDIEGVLIIQRTSIFLWVFDPFGQRAKSADISIYDAKRGELIYNLKFACGMFAKCETSMKEMITYLRGDLKKKMRHVKFRQ